MDGVGASLDCAQRQCRRMGGGALHGIHATPDGSPCDLGCNPGVLLHMAWLDLWWQIKKIFRRMVRKSGGWYARFARVVGSYFGAPPYHLVTNVLSDIVAVIRRCFLSFQTISTQFVYLARVYEDTISLVVPGDAQFRIARGEIESLF